jgi:RNA polymerase sigma factor (TIGR02999 family)
MSADPPDPRADTEFGRLLAAWRMGETGESDRLFSLLYSELRKLARHQIRRSRPGDTLSVTALVHEAYLKLAPGAVAQDRHHFFALAAQAMRQVLVDYARRRHAEKRGAGLVITSLDEAVAEVPAESTDVLVLEEALARLGGADARLRQVVELRFFGGLSVEETAEMLGTSSATVKRDWRTARAFLFDALGSSPA